jgi:hypothetical protein
MLDKAKYASHACDQQRMTAHVRHAAMHNDENRWPTSWADFFSVLKYQKCQRCALATRKSRNTWMRATDLSSSG